MQAYREHLQQQAENEEFDMTINHSPYLTRYEISRAAGVRAQQLAADDDSRIPNMRRVLGDEIKVAEMEIYGGFLDDEYTTMRKYPWSTPSERGGHCVRIGDLKIKRC
jgi:DNA-directed RNA polymerase subunit K/omega